MANQTKSCMAGAKGPEGKKDRVMARQCRNTAKEGINQCRMAFKGMKQGECKQIKASFMERIRYYFA